MKRGKRSRSKSLIQKKNENKKPPPSSSLTYLWWQSKMRRRRRKRKNSTTIKRSLTGKEWEKIEKWIKYLSISFNGSCEAFFLEVKVSLIFQNLSLFLCSLHSSGKEEKKEMILLFWWRKKERKNQLQRRDVIDKESKGEVLS